jgi:hypothetical protein
MAERDWIHEVEEAQRQRQARLMADHLEESLREMERWTEEECRRLKMTNLMREAADKAWRKVIVRSRRYLVLPRHTEVERRFLRMFLRLAVAESPGLVKRITDVARYLSRDYAFEWIISPATRLARTEGRVSLVGMGESEFGEAPYSAQFAFALYHARQFGIKNPADNNEVYATALFWDQRAFFVNHDAATRQALGLHKHSLQREIKARDEASQSEAADLASS